MRIFSIFVCLIYSSLAWAGPVTPGGFVPSLTVAGRTFTDVSSNLIHLYGWTSNSGTTQICTLRQAGGVAGYTPSGSKAFKLIAMQVTSDFLSNVYYVIAQANNDSGVATNTAITSPVYIGGSSALSNSCVTATATVGATCQSEMDFVIANGKFLSVTSSSSSAGGFIEAWGYEQ